MNINKLILIGVFPFVLNADLQASLEWDQKTVAVKIDPLEKEIAVQFCYINSGASQVVIKNIVASCNCTVASAQHHVVAPNERGVIDVKIAVDRLSNLGNEKRVLVVTDEPNARPYGLVVDIQIPLFFKLSKEKVNLAAEKGATRRVQLSPGEVSNFVVVGVRTSDDRIGSKLIENASAVEIVNLFGVEKAKGQIFVDIELSNGIQRVVKIPFAIIGQSASSEDEDDGGLTKTEERRDS